MICASVPGGIDPLFSEGLDREEEGVSKRAASR